MALVIHRGARPRSERLVLIGGDGRWIRPLLRLAEALGFDTQWFEADTDLAEARLGRNDLVLVADASMASRVLSMYPSRDGDRPMVVLTSSLHALSTPVSRALVPLPLPLTLESLAEALSATDLRTDRLAG